LICITLLIWNSLFCALALAAAGNDVNPDVQRWCQEIRHAVSQLHWKLDPCLGIEWKVGGLSVRGRPLVYAEFGDPQAENTTLIFSAVHGDEVTPLFLGLQLARGLADASAHPADSSAQSVHSVQDHWIQLNKTRVVVAPLVNPDGFVSSPKTRMNAHGVDLNRNFTTRDWHSLALANWKKKYRSDPRRFPGQLPSSEPETVFQEKLIRLVKPQKILSIHSPLNLLDYDGPSTLELAHFPSDYGRIFEQFRQTMNATSTGYFPGSLGNFAGRELGIPTVTLELPSSDPKKADVYWKKFNRGIDQMIQFTVPSYAARQRSKKPGG
jgi:protein MpaA